MDVSQDVYLEGLFLRHHYFDLLRSCFVDACVIQTDEVNFFPYSFLAPSQPWMAHLPSASGCFPKLRLELPPSHCTFSVSNCSISDCTFTYRHIVCWWLSRNFRLPIKCHVIDNMGILRLIVNHLALNEA